MDPSLTDDQPATPRSRRALLTAAAAAGGALATQALVRPSPVAAADVVLGAVNTATSVTTIRTTEATSTAKALVGLVTTAISGPSTAGVQGQSNATNGNGLFGVALSGPLAKGAWGRSASGFGVYGEATDKSGINFGVRGVTPSTSGVGVQGIASATSGGTYGVFGQVVSPGGRGVYGVNTGTNGTGVLGMANTGTGAKGVWGRSTEGAGVYGEATTVAGTGVVAAGGYVGVRATAVNGGNAVEGVTTPDGEYGAGVGVYGVCNGSHWSMGVYGTSTNGDGVVGFSSSGHGVSAQGGLAGVRGTGGNYGVRGTGVYGVRGEGSATGVGVEGTGQTGVSATGTANGVVATGSSYGVHGTGAFGIFGIGETGVYGEGTTAAGDFNGHVRVSGDLTVAGTKMFVIDHPQDPANKTLAHACVEAPEALNVYSGTATLDARGRVVIRLPGYVTSLNREYRYQLTPLGGPAPELHIAREVENSRFAIAGGSPGQRVCWIVTGLRDDPWTRKHPMRVERRKRRRDQGTYLNPELYGMPRSASVQRPPKLEKPSKLPKAPKLRKALKPPDLPRLRRRRRGASVAAVG